MRKFATFLVLALAPVASFAEVSDKLPTVGNLLLTDGVVGILCYLAARFRWWLAIPASIVPVAIFAGCYDMWADETFWAALINEKGLGYFGFLVSSGVLISAAISFGAFQNLHSRQAPTSAIEGT